MHQRELRPRSLLLLEAGTEVTVPRDRFLEEHALGGLIRMESVDLDRVPVEGLYAHFNLEYADHVPGTTYGLIRLLRHGSFDPAIQEEQLPLLSAEGMRNAVCVDIQQNLPYEALTEEHFQYSLPTIQTVEQLQDAILSRYQKSLPKVPREELLARGVSYTLLEVTKA